MKQYADMSDAELTAACSCTPELDGEAPACEACAVVDALAAGIPRSVIAGRTRLTDHFSPEYINEQCGKRSGDTDDTVDNSPNAARFMKALRTGVKK